MFSNRSRLPYLVAVGFLSMFLEFDGNIDIPVTDALQFDVILLGHEASVDEVIASRYVAVYVSSWAQLKVYLVRGIFLLKYGIEDCLKRFEDFVLVADLSLILVWVQRKWNPIEFIVGSQFKNRTRSLKQPLDTRLDLVGSDFARGIILEK